VIGEISPLRSSRGRQTTFRKTVYRVMTIDSGWRKTRDHEEKLVTENTRCEQPPEIERPADTTSRNRTWNLKRIAVIAIGWIFVVLGIAGLFLPLLQGILFLLIGLVILSKEYRWAGKLLNRIRSRFPRIAESLAKAYSMSSEFLARMKRLTRHKSSL
jgi:uncharacterized protein